MSLESFCVCASEDGTELRMLSPLSRTNLAVYDLLGSPFGKTLWAARNLTVNPAYDAASATAVAAAAATAPGDSGAGASPGVLPRGTSFAGMTMASSVSSTKLDRIAATPDGSIVACSFENTLRLVGAESRGVVAEMWVEERILNLRCNSELLAVVTARSTQFFLIDTLLPLPELRTQWPAPNFNGLGALSAMIGPNCYFALPQSLSDKRDRGDIFLYNPKSANTLTVVDAHEDAVRCIEFCGNGTRFATCSGKGQKIRVWSCPECVPLYELVRGQAEAVIFSIGMNFDGTSVVVTSNTGTLHMFKPAAGSRSVGKTTTRQTHNAAFVSPDGSYMFVLYPPDAASKTAKLERYRLAHDLKSSELEQEINLTV
jgi:hypothetical protein